MKPILFLFFITYGYLSSTLAAPTYIQKNSVKLPGMTFEPSILSSFSNKRLILLGESHGVTEFAELALSLATELSKKEKIILGLEFPINLQPVINKFLKTNNENLLKKEKFFADPEYHSGRASKAVVNLLKKIKSNKNIEVFCFDVPDGYKGNEHDTIMAKNLLKKLSSTPNTFLVLTGNIHSRLTQGTPWDSNYKTMGSEVLALSAGKFDLQNTTNILLRSNQGSAWQCLSYDGGPAKCDNHKFGPINSIYATETKHDIYFLKEENLVEGHINSIFIRNVTASGPYF